MLLVCPEHYGTERQHNPACRFSNSFLEESESEWKMIERNKTKGTDSSKQEQQKGSSVV